MSKIKYIVIFIICYGLYKGYVAFTEFEIGVSDRVTKLEEAADIEKQGEVIALMMYLGDPPELNEHLLVYDPSTGFTFLSRASLNKFSSVLNILNSNRYSF